VDTGTDRRASVASTTTGLAGLARGAALAAAVTGVRRTGAVAPRGGSAAEKTVISVMPGGDHGAARRKIPFPLAAAEGRLPPAAAEGRRSGLPVGSGVMMIAPFGVRGVTV
jgi:hypothetical protein